MDPWLGDMSYTLTVADYTLVENSAQMQVTF